MRFCFLNEFSMLLNGLIPCLKSTIISHKELLHMTIDIEGKYYNYLKIKENNPKNWGSKIWNNYEENKSSGNHRKNIF